MSKLDRVAKWSVILAGCTVAALSTVERVRVLRPIELALGLALVALGGYVYGARRATTQVAEGLTGILGRIPADLSFHRDDDGALHAMVTTVGGDLHTIEVPEAHAGSPVEAARYVLGQLIDDD